VNGREIKQRLKKYGSFRGVKLVEERAKAVHQRLNLQDKTQSGENREHAHAGIRYQHRSRALTLYKNWFSKV